MKEIKLYFVERPPREGEEGAVIIESLEPSAMDAFDLANRLSKEENWPYAVTGPFWVKAESVPKDFPGEVRDAPLE